MKNTPAIPTAITSREKPSVASWASDKISSFVVDTHEAGSDSDGSEWGEYTTKTWYFEGRMPRRTRDYTEYWSEEGKQYRISVRALGGHYKGERQLVIVTFEESATTDGSPMPVYDYKTGDLK